jgi:hypothetical protein
VNALIRAAAAAHGAHATVNTRAVAVAAVSLAAVWLAGLWLISRVERARLSRSISRSFAPGSSRRRTSGRAGRRMLARSARSRRTTRRFRKAALISALIAAAWLFVQLHTH